MGILYRPGRTAAYRTRFAEGIRLTARLRQMFNYDQWPTAPNLVSDIKLHLRPRQYPRQDQPAGDCWQALAGHYREVPLQKELFEALSSDQAGRPYQFAGFQRRVFEHVLSHYGQPGVSGTIVCAGTGSGKTKALYVPALLSAACQADGIGCKIPGLPRQFFPHKTRRDAIEKLSGFNLSDPPKGVEQQRLHALSVQLSVAVDTNDRDKRQATEPWYGPLNRHGVLHGHDTDYETGENPLRCVLLLQYLLDADKILREHLPKRRAFLAELEREEAEFRDAADQRH